MASLDFLTAVLPAQGRYCTFTMRGQLRKNIFVDDLDNLYQTNLQLSENGNNTFYALSTFDDSGTREATHAQAVRSLFMDLDCGEGKAYPSKKAAVTALAEFLRASSLDALGMPWLVDSGGGVHVYWPLDADVAIAEWKPVAEALKRAARSLGLNIDMTVTADAARVLRMPGTMNWKYVPPKPVLLRHRGSTFHFETLRQLLDAYNIAPPKPPGAALVIPGDRPSTALTTTAKALIGNTATYFKNIMIRTVNGTGCGQLQYYVDHAKEDGMEPIWRGILSWAKVCDDGEVAARRMSALHPYDEDRMHQKLAEIKGPYPCSKMDSENPGVCGSCRHWGKITNPLVLGRAVQTTTEQKTVEVPQEDAAPIELDRPEPPYGFEYGRRGGVYYRKKADKDDEEDKLMLLTPYDFFMTRMIRDLDRTCAEFKVVKGAKIITFAVPTDSLTEAKACLKVLAKNNVLAATPAVDMYLYHYVRQSVQAASAEGREVVVPPRLGWQPDGSFAVHDHVYAPQGARHDYAFASDRLHNVTQATTPQGTLEGWRSVFDMVRRKARNDPFLWGHLAAAGVGFGTILMQYTPHGSRAGVFHACSSESSAGKTFSQAMAVSMWGDTVGYLVAPSTSERTMMQRAGMLGSLLLGVDEITNKNRALALEWLPTFIFDFSAGMHKIKGSASSNAEVAHELMWSSIAFITSNTPGLEAMMGARKFTSEGEARRHLEWYIPKGKRLTWTEEENKIRAQLSHNTGIAGPQFAAWCARNMPTVHSIMQQVEAHWKQLSGATDDERFWTAMVVSIVSGYILASDHHAGIVNIPATPILEFFLSLVKRQRRIIAGNQKSAIDTLNAYTAEHLGHFIKTEGSLVMQHLLGGSALQPSSSRQMVKGRIEYNVTPGYVDYYIEERLLKLHCADNSVSYEAFLRELENSATVQTMRKNMLAGTKGPDMRVNCVKITRSLADVEADS